MSIAIQKSVMNAQFRPEYPHPSVRGRQARTSDRASARSLACEPNSITPYRFLVALLLVALMALLAVGPVSAQSEPEVQGDLCGEMLALLQADPGGTGADADLADRCSRPIDLRILMSASAIRAASDRGPSVCAPADSEITLTRVAEIFFGFGSHYLDTLYENPYALLVESLEEEFPCEGPLASATPAG